MALLFTVKPNSSETFGAGTDAAEVDCSDPSDDTAIIFVVKRWEEDNLEGYGPAAGPIDVPRKRGTTLQSITNQSRVAIAVYSA